MFEFKLLKKSKKSRARLGLLKTSHGIVETPALVAVATSAVVKALTVEQVKRTKTEILICNTYHLHLRPGEAAIKKAGGLHSFMNWNRPLMSDSGGFQVFSLGFGNDENISKITRQQTLKKIEANQQPKHLKINRDGVKFRSFLDGKEVFLGPKESVAIQSKLGADIIFAFDECPPPHAGKKYVEQSLERTHDWAKKSLLYKSSRQALFGIIQGGHLKDLRIESAKYISRLPFDGFGIGGELGGNASAMGKMLSWVTDNLPEAKPRHMLGTGHPQDIPVIIAGGADTFDTIVPTHYARHGVAFTSKGRINIGQSRFLGLKTPLDPKCECEVCSNYQAGYICHLYRAKEITGMELVSFHNLFYFNTLVEKIREAIKRDKF